MKATISLEASDLLKIARLVHDTPHDKNKSFSAYYSTFNGLLCLTITATEDSEFGYCVEEVEAYVEVSEQINVRVPIEVPNEIITQIENVL